VRSMLSDIRAKRPATAPLLQSAPKRASNLGVNEHEIPENPLTIYTPAARGFFFSFFLFSACLSLPHRPSAQRTRKRTTHAASPQPASILSDEQRIDNDHREMLGAWQLGDNRKLHSHYAHLRSDDVDVVTHVAPPSSAAELSHELPVAAAPPQHVRLDASTRSFLRVAPSGNLPGPLISGNLPLCVMEFRRQAFGHTTLIFENQRQTG